MSISVKTAIIKASHSLPDQHESLKYHLGHVVWPAKIAPILNDTKLNKLTVSFSRSECPMHCCVLDSRASAVFRKGFATGMVPELCLQGLKPNLYRPVDCKLPASQDVDEGDFVVMARAAVSDGFNGNPVSPRAVRMGEQIARWKKAKGLGREEDYGDFKWLRSTLKVEDVNGGILRWLGTDELEGILRWQSTAHQREYVLQAMREDRALDEG